MIVVPYTNTFLLLSCIYHTILNVSGKYSRVSEIFNNTLG